jgi:hypothetical protein
MMGPRGHRSMTMYLRSGGTQMMSSDVITLIRCHQTMYLRSEASPRHSDLIRPHQGAKPVRGTLTSSDLIKERSQSEAL